MAYIQSRECNNCGQIKSVNVHAFNGNCPECRAKIEDKKKREYLAGLKGLTVEERLERIEEELYDLNVEGRLSRLESFHQTYA